jgi:KTSC domain
MAKNRKETYYERRNKQENLTGQRRYNLEQRFIEVYGGSTEWDIQIPKDVENVSSEVITAPTINPTRPRALTIGYNPNTNTLIVVFRDNTWWQYNNVPTHIWVGLKNSSSTGKYLKEEGLDTWPDMGPADVDSLSEGVKAQISQSAVVANNIQNSNTTIERAINIQSFNEEDMYKDYL